MEFKGVHHVALIVSDYEKSKQFYTEVLKLPIIAEIYREDRDSYKLDLDAGNIQLELFSFPEPRPRSTYPEAAGLRHLAFRVKNLSEAVEYFQENGIFCEPVRIDGMTGCSFTFFQDPDDLPIEIYEEN